MKLPHRRQFLHLAAGATALPALPRIARAQAYPTRSITMVVPFPPGGSTDTIGRPIAERMRELNIIRRDIHKVLLAEPAFRFGARSQWLRQRTGDP